MPLSWVVAVCAWLPALVAVQFVGWTIFSDPSYRWVSSMLWGRLGTTLLILAWLAAMATLFILLHKRHTTIVPIYKRRWYRVAGRLVLAAVIGSCAFVASLFGGCTLASMAYPPGKSWMYF
jgi:hypothetical protein